MVKYIYIHLITLLTLTASSFSSIAEEDKFASVRDQLATCFTCHGENGTGHPDQPTTPILAGQESYYLYVQLKDFKAGRRDNPIMGPIASGLEKEQMKLIGKFFSEQQWPDTTFKTSPEKIAIGKTGIGSAECTGCHLGGFNGNSRVPRLAGQKVEYLRKTMMDFKTKTRTNAPFMNSLSATFDDETIDGIAEYLAGFKGE